MCHGELTYCYTTSTHPLLLLLFLLMITSSFAFTNLQRSSLSSHYPRSILSFPLLTDQVLLRAIKTTSSKEDVSPPPKPTTATMTSKKNGISRWKFQIEMQCIIEVLTLYIIITVCLFMWLVISFYFCAFVV